MIIYFFKQTELVVESLRRELEGSKNEVENMRSSKRLEIEAKDRQIGLLQQTVHGMQQVLSTSIWIQFYRKFWGKVTNIDYGNIDFEKVIETVTSTRR